MAVKKKVLESQRKYSEKKPVIGIRVERSTKEKIERIAKAEGISESELIRKELKLIVAYKKKGFLKRVVYALHVVLGGKYNEEQRAFR